MRAPLTEDDTMDLYGQFLRNMFLPLYNRARHNPTIEMERFLEETQWNSLMEIRELQERKLTVLLTHAYRFVPYYHRLFDKQDLSPQDLEDPAALSRIPLLDKKMIRENFPHLIATDTSSEQLLANSTSGSTGENLAFRVDWNHIYWSTAVIIRNDRWCGLEVGDRNARLWGSPLDLTLQNRLVKRMKNRVFRTLFLSTGDLSDSTLRTYADRLRRFRPKVLIGYSSPLYILANFLEQNNLDGGHPQAIVSSSEVLYPYQREKIERVFGCPLYNRYGCREFATIAQECADHCGLHINAEHLYVEVLKSDGSLAKPGEPGELVITNLDNFGMPFIRYRIGDIGVLSHRQCSCGRGLPLFERIEGRTFDIVTGTNGRRLGGTFWTHLFRTYVQGIERFQVRQTEHDELLVKIIAEKEFNTDAAEKLTSKIKEVCGPDMRIDLQVVDDIPAERSGKFRFVISDIPA
jgi:phenylacetate-CoA ligase